MYLGNQPALAYTSLAKQDFTTSATTSYVLDNPVANANEIALFINFVRQEPTTAYTASGTSLTLTSATSATDDMYCVFLGKAVQTVNPPAGSVGLDKIDSTAKSFLTRNYRNIIINGDMSLAQRSTSVASITTSEYYTVDRIRILIDSLGTWTNSQSTDTPTGQGFATSFKMDCTTSDASPAAGDFLAVSQRFEGQNLQYLKKGTASAVSLTASFWVKSTKTGTFIAELQDIDNTRAISKSYTVNVTNTWEKKTITFEGDTTGAFDNDNGFSLSLNLYLGAGSDRTSGTLQTTWGATTTANRAVGQVNVADDTSNDWYITGVQLEAGTTASDFEFLPVDVNLGRCLRYCLVVGDTPNGLDFSKQANQGHYYTATNFYPTIVWQYPMRSTPSFTVSSASAGTIYSNSAGRAVTGVSLNSISTTQVNFLTTTSSATAGHGGHFDFGSGVFATINSEL
jgi:hypothetical protein